MPVLDPIPPDVPGDAWIDPADLDCTDLDPDVVDLDELVIGASQLLNALAGGGWGTHTVTNARPNPCVDQGCCGDLSWWPGLSGLWGDGYGGCSCGHGDVNLSSPVIAITGIRVDGVALVAGDWRLYDKRRLVRANGLSWPGCQRLDLAATEPGTFEVAYTWGRAVPTAGIMAVKDFACQLGLARTGNRNCRLPVGATNVVRQGVSFSKVNPNELLDDGRTGLYLVDLWLRTVNPTGNRRRRNRIMGPESIVEHRG